MNDVDLRELRLEADGGTIGGEARGRVTFPEELQGENDRVLCRLSLTLVLRGSATERRSAAAVDVMINRGQTTPFSIEVPPNLPFSWKGTHSEVAWEVALFKFESPESSRPEQKVPVTLGPRQRASAPGPQKQGLTLDVLEDDALVRVRR